MDKQITLQKESTVGLLSYDSMDMTTCVENTLKLDNQCLAVLHHLYCNWLMMQNQELMNHSLDRARGCV